MQSFKGYVALPSLVLIHVTQFGRDEQEIARGRYRIIVTSPEMSLLHKEFRALLSDPKFAKRICAFVIDEAHCIKLWGEKKFREMYFRLGELRAYVPNHIPFLITSATLTPSDLTDIRQSVHMEPSKTFHINLGNDRHNISWSVRYMTGGKTDFDSLDFLLPNDPNATTLERGLVFFDDIKISMHAYRHITSKLPPHLRPRVALYHARRGEKSKAKAYREFERGNIDVLFCTEAAGMVRN